MTLPDATAAEWQPGQPAFDPDDPCLATLDELVEAEVERQCDGADPYNVLLEVDTYRAHLRRTYALNLTDPVRKERPAIEGPEHGGGEIRRMVYWRDPHANVMRFLFLTDGTQEQCDEMNKWNGTGVHYRSHEPDSVRIARTVTAVERAKMDFAADVAAGRWTAVRVVEITHTPDGRETRHERRRLGFAWYDPYGKRQRTDWLNETPVQNAKAPRWPKTPAPIDTIAPRVEATYDADGNVT